MNRPPLPRGAVLAWCKRCERPARLHLNGRCVICTRETKT